MAIFNLLHLSDFHIARHSNRTALQAAVARFGGDPDVGLFASHDKTVSEAASIAVRDICRQFTTKASGIDLIVVSGDLATTGEVLDLTSAKAFIEGYIRRDYGFNLPGFQPVDAQPRQAFVIPGNHDRFDLVGNAGHTTFETVMAEYWPPAPTGKRKLNSIVLEKKRKGKSEFLGLIGVDFSLESNSDATIPEWPAYWGQGMAPLEVIDELEALTLSLRTQHGSIFLLWVIHFPPVTGVRRNLLLRNSLFVREAAARAQIPLILAGHIHQSTKFTLRDQAEVWNAGSACQFQEPNGHHLHVLELMTNGDKLVRAVRHNFKFHYGQFHVSFFMDQFGVKKQVMLPRD